MAPRLLIYLVVKATPILLLVLATVTLVGCLQEADVSSDGSDDVDPTVAIDGDPNVPADANLDPELGSGDNLSVVAAASGLIDSEEAAFLTQINTYRRANGRTALKISIALTHSSQGHSTDMANHNYFAHNSQDGTDPFTRIKNAGYTYNTYFGENIAAGAADAASTFVQWRDACDPVNGVCTYAHRVNMLSANFTVLGIARAYSATSTYKWYWTTDFGGYTDAVMSYGTGTILANGGFESAPLGTASWSSVRTRGGWYVSNAVRSTSAPLAGAYEMQVRDPDPGGAQTTQIVLGAAGITYTFKGSSKRLAGSSGQATGSATAPAGTTFVRVFAYGSASAGVRSTFAYDGMGLTAE